jgi:predicted glycoside hydrolase/deacetylase ChbG (UPF0249 family)
MTKKADSRHRTSFCLCADDYALSPAVSRGILAALDAKRLTATSVMTTRPSWPEAAKALQPYQCAADIGLHLNLTLGAPLSRMPRFAPAKTLPSIRTVISAASRGQLPEGELRTEIKAQIEAFRACFGKLPDFVDGHQHVHVLPAVRPLLFDALESFGLKGQIWLRDSGDRPLPLLKRGIEVQKALAVAWLARGFAKDAAKHGFFTNQGFSGFSSFREKSYDVDFKRYLVEPGRLHLVMCHPGYIDEELKVLDPVTNSRPRELEFLLSPQFTDCLNLQGMDLDRLKGRFN